MSVSSAVVSFEHEGLAFTLLDTPGHQDFSEDTCRTLTAVGDTLTESEALRSPEATGQRTSSRHSEVRRECGS